MKAWLLVEEIKGRSREMTVGLIVLLTAVVMAFVIGVFVGHRFSERRLAVRASRQSAAHTSLYRQLRELQAATQRGGFNL